MKYTLVFGEWFDTPENFLRVARYLVETMTFANELFLEAHPGFPSLYESGVRYSYDEDGFSVVDCETLLDRGWGYCSQLAAWRAAEWRRKGVRAHVVLRPSGVQPDGSHLYHVLVGLPDGSYEDPSVVLGM